MQFMYTDSICTWSSNLGMNFITLLFLESEINKKSE
jgi:hypothetical protein